MIRRIIQFVRLINQSEPIPNLHTREQSLSGFLTNLEGHLNSTLSSGHNPLPGAASMSENS